jgi:hypothetical protein
VKPFCPAAAIGPSIIAAINVFIGVTGDGFTSTYLAVSDQRKGMGG